MTDPAERDGQQNQRVVVLGVEFSGVEQILQRSLPIGKAAGAAAGGEGAGGGESAIEKLLAAVKTRLAPLESRFLTNAPGREFDYQRQTAENTKKQAELLKQNNLLLAQVKDVTERAFLGGIQQTIALSNLSM